MSLTTTIAQTWASLLAKKLRTDAHQAVQIQHGILDRLVKKARNTSFGNDHGFAQIRSYDDFVRQVPLRDYEGLKPYVDRAVAGQEHVLWPGYPAYFAKTSGTTSGTKFIPITSDSIPNHIRSARNMLLSYIAIKGNADLLKGKMIFLQGSPTLQVKGKTRTGRLSGIVAHHVPAYLQQNRLPSLATNCIEEWEAKVDAIVKETLPQDMRLISGIPPWVQMYFDKLVEKGGKPVGELFPNFNLLVHGGVNFSPYRARLIHSIGREVDILETYPASEGFIAFQDDYRREGLYLNANSGIFFEFIPLEEALLPAPKRLHLGQVEKGKDYALALSSNAGLWGYLIGDTVRFLSTEPYRILVLGRVKHFISAFGEHVIAQEVASALTQAAQEFDANVVEYTVAPQVNPANGLPYHEWFVEFGKPPHNMPGFQLALDLALRERNGYYKDLIEGRVLRPLVVNTLQSGAFAAYMHSIGKLGGQNKVPVLTNDRAIAQELQKWSFDQPPNQIA